MVFDDPARIGPDADCGFALLWSGYGKGGTHRAVDLACAKLQPRKPSAAEIKAVGSEWAVTAAYHRVLLADGVADVSGARAFFESHDAAILPRQDLLAVVQTLRFPPSLPRHAMMDAA